MKLLLPIIHERDATVGKKPSQRLQAETAAPAEFELPELNWQLLVGSPRDTQVGQGKVTPSHQQLLVHWVLGWLCMEGWVITPWIGIFPLFQIQLQQGSSSCPAG